MIFPAYKRSLKDMTPEELEQFKQACLASSYSGSNHILVASGKPELYHCSIGIFQLIGILRDRLQSLGEPKLTERSFELLAELEAEIHSSACAAPTPPSYAKMSQV